ncbi:zinc finger protein [Theobroma cacao]|nr:zinc finger protein [Theobroma cacao]
MDKLVNLSTKTCSCCEFQTNLLPCSHAITAISKCKRETIEFCTDYYKIIVLVEGYAGSIRPIGHPSEWDIPLHVKQIVVFLPPWGGQAGKPRRRRILSASEVPSTNLAPSPSQSTLPRVRRPKYCGVTRHAISCGDMLSGSR